MIDGVPVTSYSLGIGQEHVELLSDKLNMLLLVDWVFAGYLMGVPVTSYSLGIGQDHVEM
jgi:hypothetical protein